MKEKPDSRQTDIARDDLREGERTVAHAMCADAALQFIGIVRTPWKSREECPRQGKPDGPSCRIEIFAPWAEALRGIEKYSEIEVLYWLDRARRDLVLQNPARTGDLTGTFALRSPARPNPIGTSLVRLLSADGSVLSVRGLDCVDGTPLLDIKPNRCAFTPKAVAKDLIPET